MLTISPTFLRQPGEVLQSVGRGEGIGTKARAPALSSFLFLAIDGFVTGQWHRLWQALSSAVKMPALLIATIFFCLPALCFSSLVLGTKSNIVQVTTVVLSALGLTASLRLGLSPTTLFFAVTSESLAFFRLRAVILIAASGSVGADFLRCDMAVVESNTDDPYARLRRLLLGGWLALHGFIGSHRAWRSSPFTNDPSLPLNSFTRRATMSM